MYSVNESTSFVNGNSQAVVEFSNNYYSASDLQTFFKVCVMCVRVCVCVYMYEYAANNHRRPIFIPNNPSFCVFLVLWPSDGGAGRRGNLQHRPRRAKDQHRGQLGCMWGREGIKSNLIVLTYPILSFLLFFPFFLHQVQYIMAMGNFVDTYIYTQNGKQKSLQIFLTFLLWNTLTHSLTLPSVSTDIVDAFLSYATYVNSQENPALVHSIRLSLSL